MTLCHHTSAGGLRLGVVVRATTEQVVSWAGVGITSNGGMKGADMMEVTNVLNTESELNQRDRVIISSAIKALFVTKNLWPGVQNSL